MNGEIARPRISSLDSGMKWVAGREKQIYTHFPSQAAIPGARVEWQPCFLPTYRKAHSRSVGEGPACRRQESAQVPASAMVLALGPTDYWH